MPDVFIRARHRTKCFASNKRKHAIFLAPGYEYNSTPTTASGLGRASNAAGAQLSSHHAAYRSNGGGGNGGALNQTTGVDEARARA